MRVVGFLLAFIIIAWVVGTLVNLYIHRNRHQDDHDRPLDPDDPRHRQRMLDEEKLRHWRDEIPPW